MTLLGASGPAGLAVLPEEGCCLSHGELGAEVRALAAKFPPPGLLFCLCHNDLPTLLCYLACLDRAVVPLLLPGGIDKARLAGLLEAYRPNYVFHKRDDLAGISAQTILHCGEYGLYRTGDDIRHVLHPDLALLLTTSGSTGSRKLVRISRRNLLANADSIIDYLGIEAGERAITTLPIHYSYGLSVINSHLRGGAALLLSDRSIMERQLWAQIQRDGATSLAGVPYTYDMLLKLGIERLKMPAMRTFTQAGGRLAPERIRRVAESCGARGMRFYTMYGQTEATARIAYLPWQETLARAGSIGRPIPGGALWLEDPQGLRITQAGCTGELIYSGPNVCLGYATSHRNLALGDQNHGILRTGDLAIIDDYGYFTLVGRASRFVKIFGNRIALDEVESLLHEQGLSATVTGTDERLDVHLEGQLPDYDLQTRLAATLGVNPTAIAVRALPSIPRLESGKIDYASLAGILSPRDVDAH
ncbi:MAG: AMP-binding protein [Sulfuritalea sp.]|nr:AMP-binding protein [Sulfuritalea sp.]